MPKPTLLSHLSTSLSTTPGSHSYTVQVLRSQPRRSHALFPHASDLNTKVWQEEVLVVLSEELEVPPAAAATAAGEEPAKHTTTTSTKRAIPILALEANIYTIPSTSCSLIYISKVDSTGLLPSASSSSPTRAFVSSFISYYLLHPPHETKRVRIHIFARAQGQYLFPGSVENKGKRVLDDKGLIKWWKKTLEQGVDSTKKENEKEATKMHYLIPGLAYLDSLPYVPATPTSSWVYGHPYASMTSPLFSLSSQPSPVLLPDLIPSFPDDPKSRFLHSLTSSTIQPSGNQNDYDDLMNSLSTSYLSTSSTISGLKSIEIEKERERERKRLIDGVEGGVEEWWERMAFRQECCSGTLVAFFVVVRESVSEEAEEKVIEHGPPTPERGSVPNPVFTKLWSQIHNIDYSWASGPSKMADRVERWGSDVESVVKAEGFGKEKDDVVEMEVRKELIVDNKVEEGKKREAPKEEKVNVMVPRKKKKAEPVLPPPAN